MKKQINEIKKMQRLAGIITESEYQESLMNENTDIQKIKNHPDYDKLINYLKTNPEEIKKIDQAAEEMKDEQPMNEGWDKEDIKRFLIGFGVSAVAGGLLGSILGGIADPANALEAILAGLASGGALYSLGGKPVKDY